MKLRKRVLIIFILLVTIFSIHFWYFYQHPNYGNSMTVIEGHKPLKSFGNARNLFHGYRMHKQGLDDKEKKTKLKNSTDAAEIAETTTTSFGSNIATTATTTYLNIKRATVFKRSVKRMKNLYTDRDSLEKNFLQNLFLTRSMTTDSIYNVTVESKIESRVSFKGFSHLNSVSLFRNYLTTAKLLIKKNETSNIIDKIPNHRLKFEKQSKVKNKRLKYNSNPNNVNMNVDRMAFAEVDESLLYDFNAPLPTKKQISRTEDAKNNFEITRNNGGNNYGEDEKSDRHDKDSSDYNYQEKLNIIDHRLTGSKSRKDMTRSEILYGNLVPRNISTFGSEIKIVSMSLYGSEMKYLTGTLKNARLIKQNFPGWKLRVYVESHAMKSPRYGLVPQKVLDALQDLGADLHFIEPEEDFLPPMMWRFLVADDPTVDRFIVRDSDSRLTERDYKSVEAWMISGQAFHCIRDHPSHVGYSVSGGLWGGMAKKLRNIIRSSWIDMMRGLSSKYFSDMSFLQTHLWPKVVSYAYCSDSVSCDRWPNSFPFSVRRYGFDHVGQVYDERDIGRRVDLKILQRRGENPSCYPPDEDEEEKTS
ncbi:hypothetical protein HELRODRAFT_190286 [Helobdella robusta]|uniref:Uncharacterized protein n=1 Tax=Helobdella robusta TaxID=6412 RepID=T1FRV1_HELRO|nr:hypothetical protein HELRODRAFT_190286 [Helobdella robusta]ESO11042.1 hypothetical protein HELRODRAFT_190286 [Helobdella robusta]